MVAWDAVERGRAPDPGSVPPCTPTVGPVCQRGKRTFDVVVTSLLLLPVSVVLAAAGLAIALVDGRPVLYRQQRVGFGGRPFTVLKLRTMRIDAHDRRAEVAHADGSTGLLFKVADDPRVTPLGRTLRRTSVDELPQLVNVLRGDMSLVGPRPLPVAPDAFGARDGSRHAVRPGVTGLWQVKGRDRQDYDQMIDLDLTYIRTWSLLGDVRILLRTVPALVRRTGPS
jgi:lipopolysaccharide/colanic/teichoic acid biosynthesis glycosyltransferase